MRELFYYYLMKFFCIFLRVNLCKNVFFFVLAKENQEVFSESCSLLSGFLQGFLKICKKYMEVNHFLLLSCITRIL